MSKSNGAASAEITSIKRFASFRESADFLWQNAEQMRGAYKPNKYDKVILPLLVVRRLDCMLKPTKDKVLARLKALKGKGMKASDPAVDVALRKIMGANPLDNFALAMKGKVEGLMVDRMDQHQEIVTRYLNDPQFQDLAFRLLVKRIYDESRGGESEANA